MSFSKSVLLFALPFILAGIGSGCKDGSVADQDADGPGPDLDADREAQDPDALEDRPDGDDPQDDADPEAPDLDVYENASDGIDGELPCHEAADVDGDTIPDSVEGGGDPDGDTVPNMHDEDSDGDGLSDAVEAGDDDPCTAPVNSDFNPSVPESDDGRPDYLDTDSDNDGLSDADETALGTDPTRKDTDGDGVTDLGETAAGADPLDPLSTLTPEDFFVILPYMEPEQRRQLSFSTTLRSADLYFLIDTTASMDAAIDNVAASLTGTIIPLVEALIPDLQAGIGHFNDFPTLPYGESNDMPYWHDVDITDNVSLVQGAVDSYPYSTLWGSGFDTPESNVVSMGLAASGSGLDAGGAVIPPRTCPSVPDEPVPRTGYPCFRPLALPILVHISDAPWHNGPSPLQYPYDFGTVGYVDAINALSTLRARHVGVFVNNYGTEGLPYMEEACRATGAVDASDNPLVVVSDDGSVSDGVVSVIEALATSTPQDVRALPRDCPDDPGPGPLDFDATQFVNMPIMPFAAFPPDSYPTPPCDIEFFYGAVPGTRVVFQVVFYNDIIPQPEFARVFKVFIMVQGHRVTRLDERRVIIIVPSENMGDIIL